MMRVLCLVYLLTVILSVFSNPLSQQVQPCNVCQPASYSRSVSIPVVVQQPSNSNPYPQATTVQVPSTYSVPLEETLNQIVLNRILGNPSLQKIIDPNTKLYNQNGNEVQRQVTNTGSPNVINNYFIVPPEFFNLNETIPKNKEDVDLYQGKKPRRRKLKKRLKKVKQTTEDDEVVETKKRRKRKQNKVKKKRIDDEIESDELNDEQDESQEVMRFRNEERELKPKRSRKKARNEIVPPSIEDSIEDDSHEIEEIKKPRKSKSKLKSKVIDEEPYAVISDLLTPMPEFVKEKTIFTDEVKELESSIEIPKVQKSKKGQRKETSIKNDEDNILKNIELPTDIFSRITPEKRPTRDSKKNVTKKSPEPINTNIRKKEPITNMTPFPDDVLKSFFPYMPMGNFNNPDYQNYPTNFDHYYRYLDPVRNSNANRSKKKNKSQSRTNNETKSNTHTIEITLKPKKKNSTTETPVTTEEPKDVQEVLVSIEMDESTESIEQITVIPMEMPRKVSPTVKDEESSSRESYETFSKLEDLHDFIMPELGTEDEVLPMSNNGIINDYYPVFDDDVYYYSPNVEKVNNIDDRYFYETGSEDKVNKEKRKMDRYEDARSLKPETSQRELDISDPKSKKLDKDINKFDHNEYLDHIAKFSNIDTPEYDIIKSTDDIRRVKVPPKNTRYKTENVETIHAGSKVAKYGVSLDKLDDYSSVHADDNSSSEGTAYIVAKSIGRPEDYW